MKKQIDVFVKANFLRSGFIMVSLLVVCVMPFALGQPRNREIKKRNPFNSITVTNTNDSGPGSLRQALATANDGDTIGFDSSLNGQVITLTSGELTVNNSIIISGPGANQLAVDGNAAGRVFHISPGRTVIISGLTIRNGSSSSEGGGIYNDRAALTLNNCVVSGNFSSFDGGGIYNYGQGGSATLTLNSSTVSGNSTPGNFQGGGIYNFGQSGSATVMLNKSTVSGNFAGSGGGILNYSAPMIITDSTISANSAASYGGGIFNTFATLTISNSTVSGNAAQYGGGIYNISSSTLTLRNSTVRDRKSVV